MRRRLSIALLLFFMFKSLAESEELPDLQPQLPEQSQISSGSQQPASGGSSVSAAVATLDSHKSGAINTGIQDNVVEASLLALPTGIGTDVDSKHNDNGAGSRDNSEKTGNQVNGQPETNPVFAEMDRTLSAVMQLYNVPGLSVAITKNGQPVFEGSYGYANKETGETVTSQSRFRVASLSKPITSAGILKLVQVGKLFLTDKVFGPEGILRDEFPTPPADSNIDQITVHDLLSHKSGWTNSSGDPMLGDYTLTAQQVITHEVLSRPLEYNPGTAYHYSNLGYSILGRVIEKVSRKDYTAFIKEEILLPAGITDMQIGGDTEQQRAPHEVKYYQSEYNPYTYNMSRMDSHGGWIATPSDLLRFMTLIDRNNSVPDLLDSAVLETTYFGSPTWTHYGSLPGTTAVLTRLNDEYSFVALANTRNNEFPELLAEELNNTMQALVQLLENWPENNTLLAEKQTP